MGHEELNLKSRQVAGKCGRLPLALSMAGRLGREDPLSPSCWTHVLESLRDRKMLRQEEVSENGGALFPVLDLTLNMLTRRLKEEFKLMAVVAPGVPVATDNLWDHGMYETRG